MKKLILSLLSFCYLSAYAQISITAVDVALTENFNTLANSATSSTVPSGWVFSETGTSTNTTYSAGTGSDNTGDTYSFGSASSTERAFGTLLTGSLVSTIGVVFTNNTGVPITALNISYRGEQWLLGATGGREDRLDFEFSTTASSIFSGTFTDVNNLDFKGPVTTGSVGLRDGNLSANSTDITGSITGLNIANGATFVIRWIDLNANGSDDGLAIDDFSITANPTTLPISLTSFTAKATNQNIQLNWKTASEENNDYFEIKRSADGKNFNPIGKIKGAGKSSSAKDYYFTDYSPLVGTNYYQLQQHDFDGKSSSSQIVAVKSKISKAELSAYANATEIFIRLSSPNQTNGMFQVFDINGRKLASQTTNLEKGINSINIPIILEKGIYLIHYSSKEEILDQRFIK